MNDLLDDNLLDPGRGRPGDRIADFFRRIVPSSPPPDGDQPPSRMQPPEDRVGFAVALVLLVAGVLILTVHGKGGAKHPNTVLPALGIVAALALPVVIVRFRNRFVSALLSAAAVLLLTSSKLPNSLEVLYFVVFVAGLGYLLWLTLRQSRAARTQMRNQPRLSPEERRAQRERRRRGEKEPERTGPTANRRYTPPKGPKPKRKRGELPETAGRRDRGRQETGRRRDRSAATTPSAEETDTAHLSRWGLRRRG